MEHLKSWPLLEPIIKSSEFEHIKTIVNKDKALVLPQYDDIGRIFSLIKEKDVKVILIGDEPYSGLFKNNKKPQADGVWLSNEYSTDKLSPKLIEFHNWIRKIYELDYTNPPKNLNYLIEQGVLILSKDLTTLKYQPTGHKDLWKSFIKFFLKKFTAQYPLIPILLYNSSEVIPYINHELYYNIDFNDTNLNSSPLMKINTHLRNHLSTTIKWNYDTYKEFLRDFNTETDEHRKYLLQMADDTYLPF